MDWKMEDKDLFRVYTSAFTEAVDGINRSCFINPAKRINSRIALIQSNLATIEQTGECDDDTLSYIEHDIDRLKQDISAVLQELIWFTQTPFNPGGILDEDTAEAEHIVKIDREIDGVYAFTEGDRILIRTPALPHRPKGKSGLGMSSFIKTFNAYSEAVTRALYCIRDEVYALRKPLDKRTIVILNVFPSLVNVMDNDNRDTSGIIDAISSFLPYGDRPDSTQILCAGYLTTDLVPGTYITVLPMDSPLPDKEETAEFWVKKLSEIGYEWPLK